MRSRLLLGLILLLLWLSLSLSADTRSRLLLLLSLHGSSPLALGYRGGIVPIQILPLSGRPAALAAWLL